MLWLAFFTNEPDMIGAVIRADDDQKARTIARAYASEDFTIQPLEVEGKEGIVQGIVKSRR